MLDEQVAELQRLGFDVVSRSESEVVATRGKWYWDCTFTHLRLVVFLEATGTLRAADIAGREDDRVAQAEALDPRSAFTNLQHGRAILQVYVAERVEPDAQVLCESTRDVRMSVICFPAALDRSTGKAYFRRKGRFWGGIYMVKLRFVAGRLLEPAAAPARAPLSVAGAVLSAVLVGAVLSPLLIMLALAVAGS